ncbi:FHA domain-containing protein [candidate division KSB1 bacterium]|nr:FHA domain-containing protein [candidate division KSB1 bacterium]
MPKIVVKRKAEIYKEYQIRPFQNRIRIGSEGDNDLIITDKKVSMHHLIIEKEGTDYFVIDTDSAFGTFVNGEKINEKIPLSSGDEIAVGDHTLLFENVLFEKGHDIKSDIISGKNDPASEIHQPATQGVQEKNTEISAPQSAEITDSQLQIQEDMLIDRVQYYLLTIYGPYIGKKYHLNYGVTKIGRDKTLNDIVIRENTKGEVDTSISRRHATIAFEENSFYIYDKRSKTRTYVNSIEVDEEGKIKLAPGDEIEIVSDQKSTIFRLMQEGSWDNSPPKKAGHWWIRHSHHVLQVTSALLVLGLLSNIYFAWRHFSVLTQKPKPFKANEQVWLTEETSMDNTGRPGEIAARINYLTPLIGDLNGDGTNDLIYVDNTGYLRTADGRTQKSVWNSENQYRTQLPTPVVLADLNGNDLPDIILSSYDTRIYAIDGITGVEIWTSALIEGEFSGAPVVVDINGDKLNDIIFCTKHGEIHVGYSTFSEPKWEVHQTNSEILCTPSAGDFNGDGISEIAIGTENGEVFIFSGLVNKFTKIMDINEELQKAKGSFFEDHQIRGHITIGKIDVDNCDDLIISTQQSNLISFSGKTFKRLWFDELIPEIPLSDTPVIPPALGDLNGDKIKDVVMFTTDSKIVTYNGLGQNGDQKKMMWGFMPEINESYLAHPVIADVNKDGNGDVIAAGLFGGIYIFNGKSGKLLWHNDEVGNLQRAIISTPLVADMKSDGYLEIVYRRANRKICLLKTNAKFPQNTILWSQNYSDSRQDGSLQFAGLNSSNYLISIILSIFLIIGVVLINIFLIKKRAKYFSI